MNKERELTSSLVKTVLKIMGKVQIYPDRKKLKEVIFINEPRNSPQKQVPLLIKVQKEFNGEEEYFERINK